MCLKYYFHVSLVVSHPFAWGRSEGGGFEVKAPIQLFSEQVWSAAFLWLGLCSYFFVCTAWLLPSFGEKWSHCSVHSGLSVTGFQKDSSTYQPWLSWTTSTTFFKLQINKSWGWLIWGLALLFLFGINSLRIFCGISKYQSRYIIQRKVNKHKYKHCWGKPIEMLSPACPSLQQLLVVCCRHLPCFPFASWFSNVFPPFSYTAVVSVMTSLGQMFPLPCVFKTAFPKFPQKC